MIGTNFNEIGFSKIEENQITKMAIVCCFCGSWGSRCSGKCSLHFSPKLKNRQANPNPRKYKSRPKNSIAAAIPTTTTNQTSNFTNYSFISGRSRGKKRGGGGGKGNGQVPPPPPPLIQNKIKANPRKHRNSQEIPHLQQFLSLLPTKQPIFPVQLKAQKNLME